MIGDITVSSPRTLQEACHILSDLKDEVRILAGGTDLMVSINLGLLKPAHVLNIWHLDELRGIAVQGDRLRIGALTTYTQLMESSLVRQYCPLLVEAAGTVGAVQTQNRGTIGGNIANGSPAGDTLPVLAAFNAELELGSVRGTRLVPFNSFYSGYRQSVLAPEELLVSILIPRRCLDEHLFFYKLGTRRAQAISKVVMAAKARVSSDGLIRSMEISVGSVAPTVIRAWNTETALKGKRISPAVITEAVEVLRGEIRPISDVRSTAGYRSWATGNLLVKFLRQISADLQGLPSTAPKNPSQS